MKKILLPIATLLASVGLMGGLAAAADSSCSIQNTGGNSNNTCTVTDQKDLKITCNNKADVVAVNNQTASSGNSVVLNNTNGGYAVSGSSTNVNKVSGKLDVKCVSAQQAKSLTPIAKTTPPAGGRGAGGQGAASSAQAPTAAPSALPNTGSDTFAEVATISAASLAGLAIVSRLGLAAYHRFSLK